MGPCTTLFIKDFQDAEASILDIILANNCQKLHRTKKMRNWKFISRKKLYEIHVQKTDMELFYEEYKDIGLNVSSELFSITICASVNQQDDYDMLLDLSQEIKGKIDVLFMSEPM